MTERNGEAQTKGVPKSPVRFIDRSTCEETRGPYPQTLPAKGTGSSTTGTESEGRLLRPQDTKSVTWRGKS